MVVVDMTMSTSQDDLAEGATLSTEEKLRRDG